MSDAALRYARRNRTRFVEDLKKALRIPSISSSPAHAAEVKRCAAHVAAEMRRCGARVARVMPTPLHPMVFAEWPKVPGAPTVLVYGHYDVQPVDPLREWKTPPFSPTVRGGKLFARGAVDDKGQVYVHLKALESLTKTTGVPLNVKFISEGEEEYGSPSLEAFLRRNRRLLAADALFVSDTAMYAQGHPSLTVGLRGLCYLELHVRTAGSDLHSGSFGGIVANPIHVLSRLLVSLKDQDGRVRVPGFYDGIRKVPAAERRAIRALPFSPSRFARSAGVRGIEGERGHRPLEWMWTRPTLDANGIWGGYTGEGSKTIIPAEATAKVSMRLVPGQDPSRIARRVERYVRRIAPKNAWVTVRPMHGGMPYLAPTDHEFYRASREAVASAFGKAPVAIREGGSIPFLAAFDEIFGIPPVLLGFGLPDERAHAPNENFDLGNFHRGIEATIRLWQSLARRPRLAGRRRRG